MRSDDVERANKVELHWPNKGRHLWTEQSGNRFWLDVDDPRATERRALLRVAGATRGTETLDGNIAVVGDSLHAIHAIGRLESFRPDAGIRLVYIDPPFNTGRQFAQYADALEHAEWLSMMRDRLEAVKPLLHPLASVWVHLDDAEVHRGRCVLDEVFGPDSFVSTIVWQKRTTRESRSAFSSNHDYIHVYAPAGPQKWKRSRNLLPRDPSHYRNRDGDPRGPWVDAPFTAPGFRANQHYTIVNPAGLELAPPKGRSWYATEPIYKDLLAENRIWFPRDGAGLPRMKRFVDEIEGLVPFSLWGPDEAGTNDDAKRHLMAMLPNEPAFATPKPEALLERILHIATDPEDTVLDFFAGSGTTAAVAHKTGRRWIAVERSAPVVASFIVPRLTKVVEGDDPAGITDQVGWTGGGEFAVFELSASVYAEPPAEPRLDVPAWAARIVQAELNSTEVLAPDSAPFCCTVDQTRVAAVAGDLSRTIADELIGSSQPGDQILVLAFDWSTDAEVLLRKERPRLHLRRLTHDLVAEYYPFELSQGPEDKSTSSRVA